MAKTIRKETRDKIVTQALEEIEFARRHKKGKIQSWQKNEDLYYGNKKKPEESRANVDLGQMQQHVHTLLSKIDDPLTFLFEKRKEAQLSRVRRLNALKEFDADRDNWDMKDIVGKKQAILYGRAIFSYSASSHEGYMPNLDNVDVYDFLIDPSAGGIDMDRAYYLGRYGVVKNRSQLEKDSRYIQTEVKTLLQGSGNATEMTKEEVNKQNRTYANKHERAVLENDDEDKYKFWEWYTTYEGKRYYLLLSETGSTAIRVERLKNVFASEEWPFWSYAAYPDLTEFWTPSPCDYVREIIMAQSVSINQMLDNAERVNKPQRIIDVQAIKNLSELKYRRDGYIKAAPGTSNSAMKIVETPSINTPLAVFEQLEGIKQSSSGVTAGALGVADSDGRATIYEGNQASAADRFGLFNKSYSFGYKRFAMLYENGVREHLTKKISVDILGPDGIEVENISKNDIFKKGESFAHLVESSATELRLSEQNKRTQTAFLSSLLGRPDLANQEVVIEKLSQVSGLSEADIRRLQQKDEFGTAEVMAEAERDIEEILDGKEVRANRVANTAYKQRFVDYMQDNAEHMDEEQFRRMALYVQSLDEIIVSNMRRMARDTAQRELAMSGGRPQQASAPRQPGGSQMQPTQPGGAQMRQPGQAQPLQDVIQQNVR